MTRKSCFDAHEHVKRQSDEERGEPEHDDVHEHLVLWDVPYFKGLPHGCETEGGKGSDVQRRDVVGGEIGHPIELT